MNKKLQLRAAQIRLLYENANTGIAIIICGVRCWPTFNRSVVQYPIILGWLAYMLLVSVAKVPFSWRRYWVVFTVERAHAGLGCLVCAQCRDWLERAGVLQGYSSTLRREPHESGISDVCPSVA